jgi:16S rRNA (cytidine1402-2'-O)-methyltransferase
VGSLHLVATPIGNLEDVTLRALRVLREARLVLAEDTRHTRTLLERHGIAARPLSLHAHNEAARVARVLAVLAQGGDVALVSDAGTPLVSDPGARLAAAAIEAGFEVVAVPGPSALLAALLVSGLPAERFTFAGFLPRKAGARAALLSRLSAAPETLVFFESPRRLAASLRELERALGPRRACVARELTKLHEEAARGTLGELARRFEAGARGEVTLVVEGAGEARAALDPEALEREVVDRLARGESPRQVAAALAGRGHPRREVYALAVALREPRRGS